MAVSARPGCGGGSDKVKDEVGGKVVCVGRGSGAWDAAEGTGEERRLWEEGAVGGGVLAKFTSFSYQREF